MDLSLGAMGSLLPKLGQLLGEEYKMQTSVKQDVEAFSRELGSMRAALQRVAEVPRDQLDGEVKLWAGDVRELSYDMEDVVDSLLVRVKGSGADADMDGFKELVSKMKSLFKKGKARRQIATAIKDIKEQVQDVAAMHERYKADGIFANLAAATRIATVDPLLVALYGDKQSLVGIENARYELIEKLCLTDDISKQPKILSIVGFGGLGKTTLAKAIYDKVESGFDCTAFVSVSRSPDLKKVFKDLLFEVDKQKYMSLIGATLDEKLLILDKLAQMPFMYSTCRYFIVVDDIWDVSAWKTIRYALMGSQCGSRIITTTSNVSVSRECCSYNDDMIYSMKPLSDGDSQRLFCNRIFSGNSMFPPGFQEVSMKILGKCAGIPLAIITLASYLASNQQIKPIGEWYVLLNSVGSGLTKGEANLDEMMRILSFSYYDLPTHLKTCLLYLSIFPEDYVIERNKLIRRWIAEGFIQGDNLIELGVSYFNELVNRTMIQPLDMIDGEAYSCRVHDIMLDLICDLASEENFVTIMDVTRVDTPFETKVRRLSIQNTELTNTQLLISSISQVRSFTIFSPAINQILPLSRFQVLRVLDLEDCNLEESGHHNLNTVVNLLHLRYLGLRNTKLREIPSEIGKLLYLQTLDLRGVDRGAKLPASLIQLRNLMFLYFSAITFLPVGYRNLTSLQQLFLTCFRKTDDPGELEYLTELRVLAICLPPSYPSEKLLILLEAIGKLQKLKSLSVDYYDYMNTHHIEDWVPSSLQLHSLSLGGWFEKLPTKISSSSFPLLSYLNMKVHQVQLEDIQILGTLPALLTLWLQSDEDTSTEEERATERSFMLSADAFPCATFCSFPNVLFAPYMFPRGAMPMVRELRFGLLVSDILNGGDWYSCIRNLPSLQSVRIKLYGEEDSSERCSEAKAVVERAAADHPNRLQAYFC